MSRDYKGSARRSGGRRNGSSLLAGILIGLILGLGIALGVAWYINKMPNPFSSSRQPSKPEPVKPPKAEYRYEIRSVFVKEQPTFETKYARFSIDGKPVSGALVDFGLIDRLLAANDLRE